MSSTSRASSYQGDSSRQRQIDGLSQYEDEDRQVSMMGNR
jgi:hypothetical protein